MLQRSAGEVGMPTLRDGTYLEELIHRDERSLDARMWADQEIFDLEMERLFARAWVPVAHVSEVESPGDFVTRSIGRDEVVVSAGTSGAIHVMLNMCSHRGAPVCRVEAGSARTHRCPFHGWTFGSDGRLMGVPYDKLVYGDRIDKRTLGLRQARVGVVGGIVFATWDDGAPPLEDYIGDFWPYLQAMLCRTDRGMEVAGPPQRYVVKANWKIVAEGFFGDVYHVPTVHRSLTDIGMAEISDGTFYGYKVTVNGHGLQCPDHARYGHEGTPSEVLAEAPPVGVSPELMPQLEQHLTPEQITLLAETPPSIAGIFPTASVVMVGSGLAATSILSLRFFVPLSVEQTELVSFTLVERDAPEEAKASLHKTTISTFGVAGIFESDDLEVWAQTQRPLGGVMGRRQRANYQALGTPSEPVLPGTVHAQRGVSGDDNAWAFYERYMEFMGGKPW